jgi:hypothetical protein
VKRSFIVLAAVIALPLLAAACGGSGGTAATGSNNPAPSPKAKASAPAKPQKFSVGQPMLASDGRSVTVVSFQRGFSTGNDFEQPKSGNEFVEVTYKLVNNSSSEWMGPTSDLSLIDANGQKYNLSYVTADGNVDGLAAQGHVDAVKQVYEVPHGTALDVVWQPNVVENAYYQTALN